MTDPKALVERLRDSNRKRMGMRHRDAIQSLLIDEAATLIESQAATIARLEHEANLSRIDLRAARVDIARLLEVRNMLMVDKSQFRAQLAQAVADRDLVTKERDGMREALARIANADYRGNRSSESQIAYAALSPQEGEK